MRENALHFSNSRPPALEMAAQRPHLQADFPGDDQPCQPCKKPTRNPSITLLLRKRQIPAVPAPTNHRRLRVRSRPLPQKMGSRVWRAPKPHPP